MGRRGKNHVRLCGGIIAPAAENLKGDSLRSGRLGFPPLPGRLIMPPGPGKPFRIQGREDFSMRRIAIINQKGGVGKTTTAVNLAAALAECGQRVCVLDLDPQAHATTHLGVEQGGKTATMYDVLVNSRPLAQVRRKVADHLWVCGSD